MARDSVALQVTRVFGVPIESDAAAHLQCVFSAQLRKRSAEFLSSRYPATRRIASAPTACNRLYKTMVSNACAVRKENLAGSDPLGGAGRAPCCYLAIWTVDPEVRRCS